MSPRGASRLRVVAPSGVLEARVPFAALCCGVIVVTLLGVLALNIALSRGAYAASDLRQQRALLGEHEQALREQLSAAEAPGAVEARAVQLGMVEPADTGYLSLAGGELLESSEPQPPPPGQPAPDTEPDTEPQADAQPEPEPTNGSDP